MKKLMFAAVAAVAFGAVAEAADKSIDNLSMSVKTAVQDAKATSSFSVIYRKQATKKITGLVVDNEFAMWEGSGNTAEYLGNDSVEFGPTYAIGTKGDKTIGELIFGKFICQGAGSASSLSGNCVGYLEGDVPAYGTWSVKQNKSVEKKVNEQGMDLADAYKFPNDTIKAAVKAWQDQTEEERALKNAESLAEAQKIIASAQTKQNKIYIAAADDEEVAYVDYTNGWMTAQQVYQTYCDVYEANCTTNNDFEAQIGDVWFSYNEATQNVAVAVCEWESLTNDYGIAKQAEDAAKYDYYQAVTNGTAAEQKACKDIWDAAIAVTKAAKKDADDQALDITNKVEIAVAAKAPYTNAHQYLLDYAKVAYDKDVVKKEYLDKDGEVTNKTVFVNYYTATYEDGETVKNQDWKWKKEQKLVFEKLDEYKTVTEGYGLTDSEYRTLNPSNVTAEITGPKIVDWIGEKYDYVEARKDALNEENDLDNIEDALRTVWYDIELVKKAPAEEQEAIEAELLAKVKSDYAALVAKIAAK